MNWRGATLTTCAAITVLLPGACRQGADPPPPPDARRPVLKSEAELSADRAERIRTGEIVVAETPTVEAERRPAPVPVRRAAIRPSRNSVRSDILMVNNSVLTVAEVLYPLRSWIEETRTAQTSRGFVERLTARIRSHVTQEIGSLLVYEQAVSELEEPQLANLDQAVDREIDKHVSREFGDSVARFENHLAQYGLTMENYREWIKRQMVVSSYTRETLAPRIQIARYELLAYYRDNIGRYSTDETRELRMIELPYDRFLPEGITWQTAGESARARAKLQAKRRARAAHEALESRDFGDVAREYSLGVHAEDGGSWGQIGQPLQPPYDEASRLIFEFDEGQSSEPIETATGYYIVQCGRIEPATKRPFEDIQEEIRAELENQKFNKLAADYIFRLAEKATISDLNGFISSAVERAIASPSNHARTE